MVDTHVTRKSLLLGVEDVAVSPKKFIQTEGTKLMSELLAA